MTSSDSPDDKADEVERTGSGAQETQEKDRREKHQLRPVKELLVVAKDKQSKHKQRSGEKQDIRTFGNSDCSEQNRSALMTQKARTHHAIISRTMLQSNERKRTIET